MSCGVSRRRGLDPALLWLCCRPAAGALIQPLAWEPPYAAGSALKRKENKQTNKQKKNQKTKNESKCKKSDKDLIFKI